MSNFQIRPRQRCLPSDNPDTRIQGQRSGNIPSRAISRQIIGGNIIGAAKMTRLEASWSAIPHTAQAYIYQHWQTLCARSRNGCEDFDHLRKYIALMQNNIPGPNGFRMLSVPVEDDGTVDRAAARAIMASFKDWSERDNCDFEGLLSRALMERMVAAGSSREGEAIGLVHTGDDAGPWGFSIELIDPMLLNPRQFQPLPNGNYIRHGIEFSKNGGRPIAYHFMEQDEQQMGYMINPTQNKRIEADKIIHFFTPELIGQKRGLPQTRTALWRLRMLSGAEDAALTNFRVSASKMGFFRDQGENGDDVEDDDLPMDAAPGAFENIGDREFIQFNPQFPDSAVEPFLRTMGRSSSSGLLSSYHSITGDLSGVSFSSIRQGTLDERDVWLGYQGAMEDGWCIPVFRKWLKYALLAGKIKLPNGRPLPFEKYDKFKHAVFGGKRWQWIDPAAEANASQILLGQKLKSRSAIIRDISDRDPEEVWDEIESEDKYMKDRNIVPLVPPGATPVLPPEAASASGATSENGTLDDKKETK
jgi:lambda family phage portal protein